MRTAAILIAVLACATTAFAGSWTVNANFTASVAMGVAAADDFAVIAGGDSGTGAIMWRSTDQGATWGEANLDAKPLMLMATGASGKSAVASGMFTVVHSTDSGVSFTKSTGTGAEGPCQSASAFRDTAGAFGITGEALLFNGVGVSTNDGSTFTASSIWGENSTYAARYGTFPTSTTWYVSAGSWPENNDKLQTGEVELTQRIRVHALKRQVRFNNPNRAAAPEGYVAGIAKTTDGGKTWTTVFSKMGEFYFNGIDCWDENNCAAVGEADSGSAPGARIYVTSDGGKTWTRTMFNAGAANSIMAVTYISATELWASGGAMVTGIPGHFHHSTDGGKTWTMDVVPGAYGTSLSFNNGRGYATVMTPEQVCGLATYA